MYKNMNKAIKQHNPHPLRCIKITHQLSFKKLNLRVNHPTGGKWKQVIHGPKHRKVNQLLSMEHSCWLSLVVIIIIAFVIVAVVVTAIIIIIIVTILSLLSSSSSSLLYYYDDHANLNHQTTEYSK